jgi:AcrR family transcriptional regulator
MAEPVNPTRPYRSPLRDRQRGLTRAAVIDAATHLFIEYGYAGTSIAKIATEAEVSAETVYAVFGSKRELLNAVVEAAAFGVNERGAVIDPDLIDRISAEPDQRRRFEMMTDATRDTLRRVGPLDEVVRAAAVADPEIAALLREHETRRLADVRKLVGLLAEAGPLRVTEREAADLMWAMSRSTDLYRALTVDRGWSDARAFRALNDAIVHALFPEAG